jgi:hypothetical protein
MSEDSGLCIQLARGFNEYNKLTLEVGIFFFVPYGIVLRPSDVLTFCYDIKNFFG